MEVILFRQILSVTITSKMNSVAIINRTITSKIASDCRTLFDLLVLLCLENNHKIHRSSLKLRNKKCNNAIDIVTNLEVLHFEKNFRRRSANTVGTVTFFE